MLVLGLCLFFTRLVGRRFGRLVVLSSVVDSVLPSVILSSVVLSSVVRLVVAVGRLVVRRPVGCRLSAVGRCRRPSVAGRRLSCRSSVVRRPFPFPVLRHPNCRGTLSPTAFHHGRPVCLLPPPGLLTVSQLSSSRLQLTLPTTVWGVSPAPPFGFRLLASASGSASLVHFPSSSSRLPSPPWPSPGFSRSPGSVLSSSPRRSRQTSLGPVPRHSLRSLGLPRGFPSLRVPLLGFVSALPSGSLSGSLLGPFWGRLSWPPSHTSPVGQSTLAVSRLFMTCRGSGPIHTSRDRAPPSLPRLRGFSPHFVRAPPSLLFTSCTSFLSPILSLP
ncbi:hypothetical protein WA556_000639 [Blastocystis sp. ATCC 50177/Nand II]